MRFDWFSFIDVFFSRVVICSSYLYRLYERCSCRVNFRVYWGRESEERVYFKCLGLMRSGHLCVMIDDSNVILIY